MEIYLLILLVMSIITFILYAIDKRKAIKKEWRIKESVLLLFSFFFGSIGGMLGLYVLRHKNKHWYFVFVNFVSLILHIILAYIIYNWKGFIYI